MKCINGVAIPDTLETQIISNREIWLYLLHTTLGDIYVVQYEDKDSILTDDYMGYSEDKARKHYNKICRKMANYFTEVGR